MQPRNGAAVRDWRECAANCLAGRRRRACYRLTSKKCAATPKGRRQAAPAWRKRCRRGASGVGVAKARVVMALSAKLTMRQGQTMVLTPQLLQAIKLLQMPNIELSAFIENELACNPLLERAEERESANADPPAGEQAAPVAEAAVEPGDWASEALETDPVGLAANLGTEIDNTFDSDRTTPGAPPAPSDGL